MKHNSKTIIVIAGIFVVLAIVLDGCGGGGGGGYGGGGGGTTTSTVQAIACPASGTTDVTIVSATAGFNPSSSTVPAVNTIVKWTNTDTTTHTVTSTTVPLNGDFNVTVNPGTPVCLKFTSAGTFNYHCTIHPMMPVGVVIVP